MANLSSTYLDKIKGQANLLGNQFNTYQPQAIASLWNSYNNPNTAYDQSQMNTLNAQTQQDTGHAANQLSAWLGSNGLSRSSTAMNQGSALYANQAQTMANARQTQMGQQQQRKQTYLEMLLQQLNGMGNSANQGYQQVQNYGQGQENAFGNALSGLGSMAGQLLGGGSTGQLAGAGASALSGSGTSADMSGYNVYPQGYSYQNQTQPQQTPAWLSPFFNQYG